MRKRVSPFLTVLLIVLFSLGCGLATLNVPATTSNVESLGKTLPALTTTVDDIPPTATPEISYWDEREIELYGFSLELPLEWIIQEVNRRPEPSDDLMAPQMGHDCADYVISNPDGTEKLYLYPVCGYTDGSGENCPVDTVLLETRGETGVIVRYFSSSQSRYIFSEARFATLISSEGESKKMLCFRPAVMVFETEESTTFVNVEYEYLGSDVDIEAALETVDRIVISIEMP